MAHFHPSDNELIEFSSGNLDWAISICVSAHIQLCPICKNKVGTFNSIGAHLFAENASPEPVTDDVELSFDRLMSNIQARKDQEASGKSEQDSSEQRYMPSVHNLKGDLPPLVKKLIPTEQKLKWRTISPGLKSARLSTGQDRYEVSFHKIAQGGKVAEHDHRGLEVTLVLQGSFSDSNGNYVEGDYIVRKPGDKHRPIAAQNQDCLCLSVLEAPVKVSGLVGKIINPFLSIRPQ